MIEFAKITGEVSGDSLKVQLRTGEEVLAVMMNVGTSTSLPTESWISTNKDNFLALVTFEKDLFLKPIIIGFYPVKGAKTSDFDVIFKLMGLIEELLSTLKEAKVNTMLGPQPFFTNIVMDLDSYSEDLKKIKKERLELNK